MKGDETNMKRDTGTIGRIVIALAICAAAPAIAEPPTPFVIGGRVLNASGEPCNKSWVWITNETGVSRDARNESTSNYYQIVLTSGDVSADDILQFVVVCGDESTATERNVTQNDINYGGFALNILIGDLPGDVNGDVTVADAVIALRTAVCGEFSDAADVIGDDQVTSLDALIILQAVGEDVLL